MPLIRAHLGASANYIGLVYTTVEECLTLIRDNLTSAGWTVILDAIATATPTLNMRGQTSNGHQCWFQFQKAASSSNHDRIRVRPFNTSAFSTAAAGPNDSRWDIGVYVGGQNRLWLVANSDWLAYVWQSAYFPVSTSEMMGVYIGFMDRVLTTDSTAWGISRIAYEGWHYWRQMWNSTSDWPSQSWADRSLYDPFGGPLRNDDYRVLIERAYYYDIEFRGYMWECYTGVATLPGGAILRMPNGDVILSVGQPPNCQGVRIHAA